MRNRPIHPLAFTATIALRIPLARALVLRMAMLRVGVLARLTCVMIPFGLEWGVWFLVVFVGMAWWFLLRRAKRGLILHVWLMLWLVMGMEGWFVRLLSDLLLPLFFSFSLLARDAKSVAFFPSFHFIPFVPSFFHFIPFVPSFFHFIPFVPSFFISSLLASPSNRVQAERVQQRPLASTNRLYIELYSFSITQTKTHNRLLDTSNFPFKSIHFCAFCVGLKGNLLVFFA
jgi:hypothetical protein